MNNAPKITRWTFVFEDGRKTHSTDDKAIMSRVLLTLKTGEACTEITEENIPGRTYYPGEGWL
jgi:hypothetical protein